MIIKKAGNLGILMAFCSLFYACNGGGDGKPPAPGPAKLPNVFDRYSVQNILVETRALNNNYLDFIDLRKIGGHATYKLRLTNPNDFSMRLLDLKISNTLESPNYYFSKNAESDNCFNQKWYHSLGKAVLNMPAHASCSFYTTSFWPGVNAINRQDTLDYVVVNDGFGFRVEKEDLYDLHCEQDCAPRGTKKELSQKVVNNSTINILAKNDLDTSDDPQINKVEPAAFALGGDYIFSKGVAAFKTLNFTRYKVNYKPEQKNLQISAQQNIGLTSIYDSVPSYSGFATSKDGLFISFNVKLAGQEPYTDVGDVNRSLTYPGIHGFETSSIQALDNTLWWNTNAYKPLYQKDLNEHILASIHDLSVNLPANNSHILGVDTNGNILIKTNNQISCHQKNANYLAIPNLASFSSLADSLISSSYLYAKDTLLANKYYDLNAQYIDNHSLPVNLYYPIDSNSCQLAIQRTTGVKPYLVVPKDASIIITDKYTAIKTLQGYIFVAPEMVSDGNNNIED